MYVSSTRRHHAEKPVRGRDDAEAAEEEEEEEAAKVAVTVTKSPSEREAGESDVSVPLWLDAAAWLRV
jgi:hypothetical protein